MKRQSNSSQRKRACFAAAAGAGIGALTPSVIGTMGLSVGGTAFAIGTVPLAIAGGVVGFAIYGISKIFK